MENPGWPGPCGEPLDGLGHAWKNSGRPSMDDLPPGDMGYTVQELCPVEFTSTQMRAIIKFIHTFF